MLSLAGCGLKGDLFLPDEPATVPTDAADADDDPAESEPGADDRGAPDATS